MPIDIKNVSEFFDWPIRNNRLVVDERIIEFLRCHFYERSFDPGPSCTFGRHFGKAPDLAQLAPGFRPEFGPVFHRGRTDGSARLLIVGQDPGSDEQIARRCFVGESGQRVQGLVRKIGLSHSYLMVNTLHLGVFDFDDDMDQVSWTDPVLSWRNELFDLVAASGNLQAVLAVGTPAREAVDRWPGASAFVRANVMHPSAGNFPNNDPRPSWDAAVVALSAAVTPDYGMTPDTTPYPTTHPMFTDEVVDDIPRRDLPWGIPDWFGRKGMTMSHREAGGSELVWEHHP